MAVIDVTGLSEENIKYLEGLIETLKQDVAQASFIASEENEAVLNKTWEDFFRVGDAVASQDVPNKDTMTTTVLAMRR